MTFQDLKISSSLLKGLADMGIDTPTPIQANAFKPVMSGRDVVGIAQTGTGKTLGFLLPVLNRLTFSQQLTPRVMILVPTRELVVQVTEVAQQLTSYMNCDIVGVYGGTNINTQKDLVLAKHDVVIGTPGRTRDLILSGALRAKDIKHLVIDEVDEMLELGFRTQLTNLLDLLPDKRQNLLFSATMIPDVEKLLDNFFQDPIKIQVAASGTPLDNIEQCRYEVPNFLSKVNLLKHLLEDDSMTKVLIFIESKKLADTLLEYMEGDFGEAIGVIHGNKSQNYRLQRVVDFERGVHRILIATSLISRGMDIQGISHVINFDIPPVPEDYMHRIGRTGRADAKGQSIAMVAPRDEEAFLAVEILMDMEVPLRPLPEEVELVDTLIEAEKEVVRFKRVGKEKTLKDSGGAFHEKKKKNQKINLAHQKRLAYKASRKKNKGRRGKKK